MTRRTKEEVIREAVEILSEREHTLTQFASRINKNHNTSKELLSQLIDDGIITTIEKRSNVKNMICVHYTLQRRSSSLNMHEVEK